MSPGHKSTGLGPDFPGRTRSLYSSGSPSDRIPTTFSIPDPVSVEEHGRTYHGYHEGKYSLPNDGEEQDRLDLQHKIWELMFMGKHHLAPIDANNCKNALDIAAGTGIWAIAFAREHPECNVVATDLSLIQPSHNTPHNLTYIREDAEDPWVFQQRFDFIHLRAVVLCFADSKAVMQRAFDHLEPGGWCEYDDMVLETVADPGSETFVRESAMTRVAEFSRRGLIKCGKDPTVPGQYRRWMEEIGFTDIVEKQILCPMSGWPIEPRDKVLGNFMGLDVGKAVPAMYKLVLAGGLPQEEIQPLLDTAIDDLSDPRYRAYTPAYVVYGRKPTLPAQPVTGGLLANLDAVK